MSREKIIRRQRERVKHNKKEEHEKKEYPLPTKRWKLKIMIMFNVTFGFILLFHFFSVQLRSRNIVNIYSNLLIIICICMNSFGRCGYAAHVRLWCMWKNTRMLKWCMMYIYILIFGRFWDCIVLVSSWFRRIYITKTISAESQHTTHSRSEDQPIVLMGCLLSESCQTEWNCDWFFRQCGDDSHTMTDQLRRKQSASDPLDSRPVSAIKNWAGAMHRRAYTMAVTCNSSINNRSGENGAVG